MKTVLAGENSLIVYLAEEGSEETRLFNAHVSTKVQQLATKLEQQMGSALIDLVPSYASLLVLFDPEQTDHQAVENIINDSMSGLLSGDDVSPRLIELPVFYGDGQGDEVGPDLARIADLANLTPDQVIDIHQSQEYRVYAIGFAPGFAYLGEVDQRIAAPRLATPRLQVPAGAVAIADRQTAVYPAVSPGGWNLIGLCPTPMFNPGGDPVMPVAIGDRIRFRAIGKTEFLQLGGDLASHSASGR